jgi:hypothetical protein
VYLLSEQTLAVKTAHASLRTAVNSQHLSLRMTHLISFFANNNFVVYNNPGKNKTNSLADALSRRPHSVLDRRANGDEDDEDSLCLACVDKASTHPLFCLSSQSNTTSWKRTDRVLPP